ncbi:MAG: hypothetical protein A4E31_01182 [Methanomassiliicoccales archaeon PtaU1.Bin030]|jgi:hypothetical protein|nr:MAG: hypothetical protein A4E31_01182 [Methanomassiliicoccales archaeon PtaU1.Bin030]
MRTWAREPIISYLARRLSSCREEVKAKVLWEAPSLNLPAQSVFFSPLILKDLLGVHQLQKYIVIKKGWVKGFASQASLAFLAG